MICVFSVYLFAKRFDHPSYINMFVFTGTYTTHYYYLRPILEQLCRGLSLYKIYIQGRIRVYNHVFIGYHLIN